MGKTYAQQITTHEVSLTIENFLVAAYGATFTPGRVDVSSPPSGFLYLGATVEDSPSIRISREKYSLSTGIPKVIQYEKIVGVSGEISFSLYTNSWWQAQFALGNVNSITTVTTVASGAIVTQYYGKGAIVNYHLLGVADFTNGVQVIHEFPKVSPSGDWEETFRPSDANTMPFAFTAIGYQTIIGSCTELVLGMRHYISGDGVDCTDASAE